MNFNKVLMSVIVATTVVVKAEEFNLGAQFEASKKQVNALISKVDIKDIQEKVAAVGVVIEKKAQSFFTTNPVLSAVLGAYFIGKGRVYYTMANNAAKYIHNRNYPMLTLSKELACQIEHGTEQAKNAFIRSFKKAGKINTVFGLGFSGGCVLYNHIKKNENSVVEDKPNALSTEKKELLG